MSVVRKNVPGDSKTAKPTPARPDARRSRFCRRVRAALDQVLIAGREALGDCVLKRCRVYEGGNCFAVRTARMSSGRAHAQPTFQPVKEKVSRLTIS